MARESNLTQERVSAAADALMQTGVRWPSVGGVREYLRAHLPPGETKVGGTPMIQAFMKVWSDQQHGKTPERLPASSLDHHRAAIEAVLSKVAQDARDECSLGMVAQNAELTNTVEFAKALESEIDRLSEELEACITERNTMAVQHAMMGSELGEHKLLLSSAAGLQSGLQIEIAELRFREAALKEWQQEARVREAASRQEITALQQEISRERDGRLEAQKRFDLLQVQLDSTTQALSAAENRFGPLLALVEKNEPVAVRAAMAESRIPDLQAHIEALEGLVGSDPRLFKRLLRTRRGPQQSGQKTMPSAN
jgi:FtsZ-binding cell division protein ZapB